MNGLALTPVQLDRACGAVLGSAIGDALGAPYEFDMVRPGPEGPRMIGGGLGGFAPGEWTDDTAMAWAILEAAASGADLRSDDGLTAVARNFRRWYESPPADIGNQTREILGRAGPEPTGASMTALSRDLHARTGMTAGNGSLMRTAPVALPYLGDPAAVADAARKVGALTHYDPHAQSACVLWSLAIHHAILTGELDVRTGLSLLDVSEADYWAERLAEAESSPPSRFRPNTWAVAALQAAWSAIVHTPAPPGERRGQQFQDALAAAIRIGNDTDTVAAIAGALLGAVHGASAIPEEWRRISHGYPGLTGQQLVELAEAVAKR